MEEWILIAVPIIQPIMQIPFSFPFLHSHLTKSDVDGIRNLQLPVLRLEGFCVEVRNKFLNSGFVSPSGISCPQVLFSAEVYSEIGGCQNHGPLLGTLNIRCRIIIGF